MITRVNSTSDSMKARPRIRATWMAGRAAGFRAMASQAAAPTRPCPRPARPAAIAMPKPEAIGTQGLGAAAVPPCAYAGMVIIRMASSAKITIISFRIYFLLMNRCQWVVDVHRADALTLTAAFGTWYLAFGNQ